jgi:hypothetical protein
MGGVITKLSANADTEILIAYSKYKKSMAIKLTSISNTIINGHYY